MRNFHKILFTLACVLMLSSCYEDNSTLQSIDIPDIMITVPDAIKTELSVVHGSTLNVEGVVISRTGDGGIENLKYEWSYSLTTNDTEPVVLATTKDFHEVIDLPISSGGYLFVLTVRDPQYDTKYQYQWKLYVTAKYGEGLVVAYTKDGQTSDLGLVMHPQLTKQYSSSSATIHKDLLMDRNGSPLPSPISNIIYTFVPGSATNNILWASTGDDLMRIETNYYEILGHKNDVFVFVPEGVNIEALYNTYQCTMVVNNGKIYETMRSREQISAPAEGSDQITIERNIISAHTAPASSRRPSTIFYDNVQEKICYGYNTTFKTCTNVSTGSFTPGNMPGKRIMAGGISVNGTTHCLLMEDKNSGSYTIYTFGNVSSDIEPTPLLTYDMPSAANDYIKNASALFFSEKEPVLYIAHESKIYTIIFESGAVAFDPTKPVFTAPTGEHITMARLYLQGYYAAENYGGNATLDWNSRAVVVITSKDDNNDKIHVVPQINFGSGQLDQSQGLVFDGFGKITAFTVAGLVK